MSEPTTTAPPVSPERLRALERLAHAVKVWHRKSAESRALSHELSLKVEAAFARTEITAALTELERWPAPRAVEVTDGR